MSIEEILLDADISPFAGVDEAGRGACAGPLVIAAVILSNPFAPELSRIRDSKEIGEAEREQLFDVVIGQSLSYSIVEVSAHEIDTRGVHVANIEGMRRAVNTLSIQPKYVLTDGYAVPGMSMPSLGIWKGDQVVHCISAASILAKVSRDRIMRKIHEDFPEYGFVRHKGYSTALHIEAIRKHGPLEIHRRSFSNVASLINIKG